MHLFKFIGHLSPMGLPLSANFNGETLIDHSLTNRRDRAGGKFWQMAKPNGHLSKLTGPGFVQLFCMDGPKRSSIIEFVLEDKAVMHEGALLRIHFDQEFSTQEFLISFQCWRFAHCPPPRFGDITSRGAKLTSIPWVSWFIVLCFTCLLTQLEDQLPRLRGTPVKKRIGLFLPVPADLHLNCMARNCRSAADSQHFKVVKVLA